MLAQHYTNIVPKSRFSGRQLISFILISNEKTGFVIFITYQTQHFQLVGLFLNPINPLSPNHDKSRF